MSKRNMQNNQHSAQTEENARAQGAPSPRRWLIVCLSLTTLMCLFLFWPGISDPGKTLWFSDGNVVQQRNIVEAIRDLGGFGYSRGNRLGGYNDTGAQFYPNWPLVAFLPIGFGMWFNIFAHILWASAGGWYCARRLGVSPRGAAIAGIAFGLNGHFLSLMGAGHLGKLQCIPWIPWVFGLFWQGWQSGRMRHFFLASLCYAAMWQSGEPPLAYFLGIFLGCFTLVRTVMGIAQPAQSRAPGRLATLRRAALSALFILLTVPLAWQSIASNLNFMERLRPATRAAPTAPTESAKESSEEKLAKDAANYEFAVSWSFPPEETLVFLMSGRLFGVASPVYWGRTGSKTMKLKQVDDYMGVLVVLFAIIAITAARGSPPVRFMLFVLCASLLIGFGGFTPLYRVIYRLPVFGSLRVPARWIALTAFAFSMLAGLGHDRFIDLALAKRRLTTQLAPIAVLAVGGTLLLVGVVLSANRAMLADRYFGASGLLAAAPQPQLADLRMGHFISAFVCTGISLVLASGVLASLGWAAQKPEGPWLGRLSRQTLWTCLAGFLLAGDLAVNDKHYMSFFDWKQFYRRDGLVEFFKNDTDAYSILALTPQRHPYLNRFVSYLAPWHRQILVEPHVVHRQEAALLSLLNALSKPVNYHINPRFYDYFGVKYVLSPGSLPADLLAQARLQQVHRFDIPQMPPLFLYQYHDFMPAPYLAGHTVPVESEQDALKELGKPAFNIRSTTVVENGNDHASASSVHGTVRAVKTTRRHIVLEAQTDTPTWVVLRMRYNPRWSITVNGAPWNHCRANYMQTAIPIAPGASRIEMRYHATRVAFFIVLASWIAGLLAWLVMGVVTPRLSRRGSLHG